MSSEPGEFTALLGAAQQGDPKAAEELLPLVYEELRKLAAQRMAQEAPGNTLQATALVHEAWLRLTGKANHARFENRAHFFAAAAEAMRRILIERARRKLAQRRGGGVECVSLEEIDVPDKASDEVLLRVSAAVDALEGDDARAAQLVKLRFFAGLSMEQVALALGVTERTARRDWRFARAWLFDALKASED